MADAPIMATNDDASECKRSAVQLGYWEDKYISFFAKKNNRRAPEINRGYYGRVKGVEYLIHKFLRKAGSQAQIVNIGAGFDTLYWRLKDQGCEVTKFIEIDFPTVTSRKCYTIKQNVELLEKLSHPNIEVKHSQTDMHADTYHCVGADLRNIPQLQSKLEETELDFQTSTLFIAECVLVYIESDCVNRLLSWIASKFTSAMFINYEMCNMNDHFGEIMLDNLKARGCNLAGIGDCKNMDSQKNRFLGNGWQGAKGWDMVEVYFALPTHERLEMEKLEFLDEQELLMQLLQHYCICVGWLGSEFADISVLNK